MGWKIIFAPQALEQLEQIVRYIAQKLTEGEALKAGMEQRAREFKESGAEVYAKA